MTRPDRSDPTSFRSCFVKQVPRFLIKFPSFVGAMYAWARSIVNKQGPKKRTPTKIKATVAREKIGMPLEISMRPLWFRYVVVRWFVVAYWWRPSPITHDNVFLLRRCPRSYKGRAENSGTRQSLGIKKMVRQRGADLLNNTRGKT